MAHLSARRALAALIVALIAGLATGTLAALDSAPAGAKEHHRWWDKHKGRGHGHGDDGATTTATITTTTTTTPTSTATTPTAPTPATTTTAPAAATGAGTTAAAPAPELNRTVALAAVSGTVVVRPPGGAAVPLTTSAAPLPTGTRVDTRAGEVALTSAVDASGATQTGRFSGGVFEVRQARGYTQLVLVGGHWGACRAGTAARRATTAAAAATKKRKPIRRLWGKDDHGRFQTRGGGSVATVRGTRWLTEDFCDGTRTTVTEGAVAVRSRRTGRTVVVRAGHRRFVAR